jgi:hypothetical protein
MGCGNVSTVGASLDAAETVREICLCDGSKGIALFTQWPKSAFENVQTFWCVDDSCLYSVKQIFARP